MEFHQWVCHQLLHKTFNGQAQKLYSREHGLAIVSNGSNQWEWLFLFCFIFLCPSTFLWTYFVLDLFPFYIIDLHSYVLINLPFLSTISAFGVDAAFSYKYNQQLGVCDKDGLAICPGFTTTHVIPVCFPRFALFIPEMDILHQHAFETNIVKHNLLLEHIDNLGYK